MINVENFSKKYGDFTAVDDISFQIKKGEICGFLGPNGAGKTSTMRTLSGFMPPTSGRITVAGFDLFEQAMEVKKRVGYLPESNPLYTDMRVAEYLGFVAEIKGLRGAAKLKMVDEMMEETGLTHRRRSLIGALSKGYRQRVGMAQALMNDPEILILDEPSIGLDPMQIIEIRNLIKNLSGRRTVILSTHILPEAQMICSRVMIINKGKLVASGAPSELSNNLKKGARITTKIEGPPEDVSNAVAGIAGVEDVSYIVDPEKERIAKYVIYCVKGERPRKRITSLIAQKDWDLIELSEEALNLEDIFLELIEEEAGNDEGGE